MFGFDTCLGSLNPSHLGSLWPVHLYVWPYDWLLGIIPFHLDPYFGGSQAWPGAFMAVAAAWGIVCAMPIFVLASIGKMYGGAGPFNFVFWGPETLLQVWWLTLPAGVFTAWIYYAIYPWGFSQSHQTSRTT